MAKSGKTLTILLLVLLILCASLTTIVIYFYQREREMRKTAEARITELQVSLDKAQTTLDDLRKQAYIYEEKNKEAEEKINSLMDELDFERGLREETKQEVLSLTEDLEKARQAEDRLTQELNQTHEKINQLKAHISQSEKTAPGSEAMNEPETNGPETDAPSTERIPRDPSASSQSIEGLVLNINEENGFIIFDQGLDAGVEKDMGIEIFHNNTLLGKGKVARVEASMAVADLIPPLKADSIRKEDRVVVQP